MACSCIAYRSFFLRDFNSQISILPACNQYTLHHQKLKLNEDEWSSQPSISFYILQWCCHSEHIWPWDFRQSGMPPMLLCCLPTSLAFCFAISVLELVFSPCSLTFQLFFLQLNQQIFTMRSQNSLMCLVSTVGLAPCFCWLPATDINLSKLIAFSLLR